MRSTRTDLVGAASVVCLRLHLYCWKGKKKRCHLGSVGGPCEKTAVPPVGREMAVISSGRLWW